MDCGFLLDCGYIPRSHTELPHLRQLLTEAWAQSRGPLARRGERCGTAHHILQGLVGYEPGLACLGGRVHHKAVAPHVRPSDVDEATGIGKEDPDLVEGSHLFLCQSPATNVCLNKNLPVPL